jgi:hypothetical protein
MSDFRLPALGQSSLPSESFIAYTTPCGPQEARTYLIYDSSTPLPEWSDSPEKSSILSFDVNKEGYLISEVRYGCNSAAAPGTIESGLRFAERIYNPAGKKDCSDLARLQLRYPSRTRDIVKKFDDSRQPQLQILPGRKFVGRGPAAKRVQDLYYDYFDSFVQAREANPRGGAKSVLAPFDGDRAETYHMARKRLLQVIWEYTKDSRQVDDLKHLEQLVKDLETILREVLEYIAERHYYLYRQI